MQLDSVTSHAASDSQNPKTRAAMTSLTLPAVPLVDFFPNSILEGFCLLLHSKVQSYLTILQ